VAVTEEDVQKKRDDVEKLRAQIAEARSKETVRLAEEVNEVTMLQLEGEEARLEVELIRAREAAKKSTIQAGSGNIKDQAEEQKKAAEAAAKAADKAKE
jgi:hypothetical protein